MNKIWHKIFNKKNFFYNVDSNLKLNNSTNYKKLSYLFLKIVHPELNKNKFRNILKFLSKNLLINKKESILDFGSGNGALLLYLKKKYSLRKNFSFEISKPLLTLQKKFIKDTKFIKTHHLETNIYKQFSNISVDNAISISVFQYFYNQKYFLDTLEFLIKVTKKRILIYDIKDFNKKKKYKETVRKRQNLSRVGFFRKYKNTPIRFYSKKYIKKTLNSLKNKHKFSYKFLSLPKGATDYKFGYCLLIIKNDYINSKIKK